jgi:hypothetical protein
MHVYTKKGRQSPVFLPHEEKTVRFYIEADGRDDVRLEYSFDPGHVRLAQRVWENFEGGWAGELEGPPTAIRVNIERAKGPVFLWVKTGEQGEKNA